MVIMQLLSNLWDFLTYDRDPVIKGHRVEINRRIAALMKTDG